MKQNNKIAAFFLIAIFQILIQENIFGNERKFSFTYESNVLSKGMREIEIWNTSRIARSYFFRRLDQRIEYEVGLGNNLQAAFYINQVNELKDDNGATTGGSISRKANLGFSNEWKYKIFDNVADHFGFALYGEFTFYPHETEYEGKLIFDKQFENILVAANLVYELENKYDFKNGAEIKSTEKLNEIDFGVNYSPNHNFSFGFEAINKRSSENSILFFGPSFSYSVENFWIVASYLPQVKAFKGATTNNLNLNSYEKSFSRILFSFEY